MHSFIKITPKKSLISVSKSAHAHLNDGYNELEAPLLTGSLDWPKCENEWLLIFSPKEKYLPL